MSARTTGRMVLAFAHIGDLHVTDANQPNFIDLMSILVQLETQAKDQLSFAVIPGDCADMVHTHYNELANDGTTIFAATRSTGQIDEGPVGDPARAQSPRPHMVAPTGGRAG